MIPKKILVRPSFVDDLYLNTEPKLGGENTEFRVYRIYGEVQFRQIQNLY